MSLGFLFPCYFICGNNSNGLNSQIKHQIIKLNITEAIVNTSRQSGVRKGYGFCDRLALFQACISELVHLTVGHIRTEHNQTCYQEILCCSLPHTLFSTSDSPGPCGVDQP